MMSFLGIVSYRFTNPYILLNASSIQEMNGAFFVKRSGRKCMNLSRNFHCVVCKHSSEACVVKQVEELYYEYNIAADQWKDFHGDGNILLQQFLCEECNVELETEYA
jgi:hypothetical protein